MTRRIENTVNVSHQKTLKALSHERVIILLYIAAVHVTPFTVFAPVHSQAPCHLPSPVRGAHVPQGSGEPRHASRTPLPSSGQPTDPTDPDPSIHRSIGPIGGQQIFAVTATKTSTQVPTRSRRSVGRSVGRSVNRSVGRSVGWSVGRSVDRSINQSAHLL